MAKAPTPGSRLEQHLGYWLRLVSDEISGRFAQALQACQISVAEWVALNHIGAEAGLTPVRLAATVGMTRGAVSKVIDKLERKKLVVRAPRSINGRGQQLSLTARGRQSLPTYAAIAEGNDRRFFSALSQRQRRQLRALLRRMAERNGMTRNAVE